MSSSDPLVVNIVWDPMKGFEGVNTIQEVIRKVQKTNA